MKPFKVEKIVVQAKSRTLKATWTMEESQDIADNTDYSALAKILQEEIDKEILRELIKNQGWTEVIVKKTVSVDQHWCSLYIKDKHRNIDNYWYFENQKDAHFFLLKWGS